MEPKLCIFCPSKIISSPDVAKLHRTYVLQLCHYCTLVSNKFFEQLCEQPSEKYFCSYCSTNHLEFNEFWLHVKRHYREELCICPGEVQGEAGCRIDIKEENILPILFKKENICTHDRDRESFQREKNFKQETNNDVYSTNHKKNHTEYQSVFVIDKTSINTDESRFKCAHCEFKTTQRRILRRHLNTHTRASLYNCNQCEFKTSSEMRLKSHLKIHMAQKLFHCNECEYMSRTKGNLKAHLVIHTKVEKSFDCNLCKYKGQLKSDLTQHMRVHSIARPFRCDLCEYACWEKSHLQRHNLSIHLKEKPYNCDHCGCKFSTKISLYSHTAKHTGKGLLQCDHCMFKATNNTVLKIHLRIHTGEKPFQCNICKFRSARQSGLDYHLKSHIGFKQFQCGDCDHRSLTKGDLKKHLNIHMKENSKIKKEICPLVIKPFHCDHCMFKCKTNTSFKIHLRKHIREKQFHCFICKFRTLSNYSLNYHFKRHIRLRQSQCRKCGKSSQLTIGDLKKHFKIHMKENEKSMTSILRRYRKEV